MIAGLYSDVERITRVVMMIRQGFGLDTICRATAVEAEAVGQVLEAERTGTLRVPPTVSVSCVWSNNPTRITAAVLELTHAGVEFREACRRFNIDPPSVARWSLAMMQAADESIAGERQQRIDAAFAAAGFDVEPAQPPEPLRPVQTPGSNRSDRRAAVETARKRAGRKKNPPPAGNPY